MLFLTTPRGVHMHMYILGPYIRLFVVYVLAMYSLSCRSSCLLPMKMLDPTTHFSKDETIDRIPLREVSPLSVQYVLIKH